VTRTQGRRLKCEILVVCRRLRDGFQFGQDDGEKFCNRWMDMHCALDERIRRLRIHDVQQHVNHFIASCPENRRTQYVLCLGIDRDFHESLSFSLLNGPGFASVTTTGPTTGNLHLAPSTSDAGTHALTVAASDGTFDSRRSATIRVLNATGVASDPTAGKFHVLLSANPINRTSALIFRTSKSGFIRANIYDTNGRLVRTLKDTRTAPPGRYELRIDGRDEAGNPLASGVYFFKVETSEGSQVGRATVLK